MLENKINNVESDVGFKFYYEHHMDLQWLIAGLVYDFDLYSKS